MTPVDAFRRDRVSLRKLENTATDIVYTISCLAKGTYESY